MVTPEADDVDTGSRILSLGEVALKHKGCTEGEKHHSQDKNLLK
jgi:hypothetical protein